MELWKNERRPHDVLTLINYQAHHRSHFSGSMLNFGGVNEQPKMIQLPSLWRKFITDPHLPKPVWNSNICGEIVFSSSVPIFPEGLLSENHIIMSSGGSDLP